jgi:hypothetical protein
MFGGPARPAQFSRPVTNTPLSGGNYGPTPGAGNIAPVSNDPALCNRRNAPVMPGQGPGAMFGGGNPTGPAGLGAPIAIMELMKAARGGR